MLDWQNISPEHFGFALAALAYLVLCLLVLTTKSRNVQKSLLLAFFFISFLWALHYVIWLTVPFTTVLSHILESSRYLFLLLFLFSALNQHNNLCNFLAQPYSIITLLGLALWLIWCIWLAPSKSLTYTGYMTFCVLALALLETLYRRSSKSERWQFKPLLIALAAGITFDFVLLAESALFARIDTQLWQARGFIFTLMIPFLVIAIRRIEAWGI
ncbi:MAG: PEP-CTERM system histidine kinase PrsK, partial [Paraglaciecola sp.]|nr:PEP-CTERM system histidine kinase PrsK [Paraglaciecola sp.]